MTTTPVSAPETFRPASPTDLITSLWRGLQILELLVAGPEGLLAKRVSFRTGLNLGTYYHQSNTLVVAGYATRQGDTQRIPMGSMIGIGCRGQFIYSPAMDRIGFIDLVAGGYANPPLHDADRCLRGRICQSAPTQWCSLIVVDGPPATDQSAICNRQSAIV